MRSSSETVMDSSRRRGFAGPSMAESVLITAASHQSGSVGLGATRRRSPEVWSMHQLRPFRFGVSAYDAASREAWLSLARRAEALGYSTLTINDHLGTQPAPIAAIAAAAQVTTTLRLGCGVFANDF